MEYKYITSRTNPIVSLISSLKEKKYRLEYGLYICEGIKVCEESLNKSKIKYSVVCEGNRQEQLLDLAYKSRSEIFLVSESVYKKITLDSAFDGIMFIIEIPNESNDILSSDKVLFLDSVRDPGNLGTIIRTAVAFGFDKILLLDCVDIYNPKVIRSTMGAIFNIDIVQIEDCNQIFEFLRRQNRKIYAATLDNNSIYIDDIEKKASDVIIIGNEGHGVSLELINKCDNSVIIPISKDSESLNASVAASIFIYEYRKLK